MRNPVSRERVAVVGTRRAIKEINEKVREFIDALPPETIVVTGDATGVDFTALNYALSRGLSVVQFYARGRWDVVGNDAGPERNGLIAEFADRVIAFPCSKSTGTWNCVRQFQRLKKDVKVVRA